MRFLEIVVIIVPVVVMDAIVISVITGSTIKDFEIYIAVTVSGLVSLGIAYYFHKKDTPAQMTWNEKRKETMEEMIDLFEQLSRHIRVGSNLLDKAIDKLGYSQETLRTFVFNNQKGFDKLKRLQSLIFTRTDRNYNYLTNKETRLFKMMADTLMQYLDMKMKRPEKYLDDIKYLEYEHTIKRQLLEVFDEVDSSKKEFLNYGVFELRGSDLESRWEDTHRY